MKRTPSVVDVNLNTNWISYPGTWTAYVLLIIVTWLLLCSFVQAGQAWTYVHLIHSAITFYMFHWVKGSPVTQDQGSYDNLTFWEQMDGGVQLTENKKFFTVVPVLLFIVASHSAEYEESITLLNLVAVMLVIVAKFPNMHKVRLFGINAGYTRT